MTGTPRLADRRAQRRQLRHAGRRRRRGGSRRGPLAVQRAAKRGQAAAATAGRGWRRLIGGDRPLVVMLLAALGLALVMLSVPMQRQLDGQDRVDTLTAKVEALEAENRRLERRVEDLNDPLNIELLAREQQGLVRPGEVPYTLVPPEVERPRITAPREVPEPDSPPWHRRLWAEVTGWLGS